MPKQYVDNNNIFLPTSFPFSINNLVATKAIDIPKKPNENFIAFIIINSNIFIMRLPDVTCAKGNRYISTAYRIVLPNK